MKKFAKKVFRRLVILVIAFWAFIALCAFGATFIAAHYAHGDNVKIYNCQTQSPNCVPENTQK